MSATTAQAGLSHPIGGAPCPGEVALPEDAAAADHSRPRTRWSPTRASAAGIPTVVGGVVAAVEVSVVVLGCCRRRSGCRSSCRTVGVSSGTTWTMSTPRTGPIRPQVSPSWNVLTQRLGCWGLCCCLCASCLPYFGLILDSCSAHCGSIFGAKWQHLRSSIRKRQPQARTRMVAAELTQRWR